MFSNIKEKNYEFLDQLFLFQKFYKEKLDYSVNLYEIFYAMYEEQLNYAYIKTFDIENKIELFNKLISNANASPELLKWRDDFTTILKKFQASKEIYERLNDFQKKESVKPDEVFEMFLEFSKSKLPLI